MLVSQLRIITLTLSSLSAMELTKALMARAEPAFAHNNLGNSVALLRNLKTFMASGRPGRESGRGHNFSELLSLEA